MHFSWNISWLCFYFFSGTLFLVQDSISWKKFVNTKFYNSLKKRNFRIRWCWIRWKALFIYCSEHFGTSRKNGWKKLVKWRTRKKKSAASEVHYGRYFQILTKNYESFFQQRRIGQSDPHVAYLFKVILLWVLTYSDQKSNSSKKEKKIKVKIDLSHFYLFSADTDAQIF